MSLLGAGEPRPVADAPVGALADGSAVAQAWLIELMAAGDLAAAARVPVADLVSDAPALAAAIIAALGSDAALDDVREHAARAGRLAGDSSPAGAAVAVEALRGATWRCLAGQLTGRDDALATALALRLAHVCALATQAAVQGEPARSGPAAAPPPFPVRPPWPAEPPPAERTAEPPPPPVAEPVVGGAVAAHDARAATAPAPEPWIGTIEERLGRHRADGRPFSLLLIEVDGLDRLIAAASGQDVVEAMERVERAVHDRAGPADALVRERLGRYWLTASDTGASAARLVAERIADAVSSAAQHRGVPLTVSIGLAACPDDGVAADDLVGRAEEGVFAARAAGVRIA